VSERPISRGRSLASPRVWIADPNPVFREGLAGCLESGGYQVVGMSSGLIPEPPLGAVDVLVFDLGNPVVAWGVADGSAGPNRLIGFAVAGPGQRLETAELDSVVVRSEATPANILAAVGLASGTLPVSRRVPGGRRTAR